MASSPGEGLLHLGVAVKAYVSCDGTPGLAAGQHVEESCLARS